MGGDNAGGELRTGKKWHCVEVYSTIGRCWPSTALIVQPLPGVVKVIEESCQGTRIGTMWRSLALIGLSWPWTALLEQPSLGAVKVMEANYPRARIGTMWRSTALCGPCWP